MIEIACFCRSGALATEAAEPAAPWGLGVAVARGFIEARDGSIELEDTPGRDATLVVALRSAT